MLPHADVGIRIAMANEIAPIANSMNPPNQYNSEPKIKIQSGLISPAA